MACAQVTPILSHYARWSAVRNGQFAPLAPAHNPAFYRMRARVCKAQGIWGGGGTTHTKIEAIIFDLGGVLIQVYEEGRFRDLEARWGLLPGQLAEILWGSPDHRLAEVGAITDAEYWRRIAPRLGLRTIEAVRAFQQDVYGPVVVNVSMVDLVRRLRGSYRTALLSNASDVVTPAFIAERYGFGGLFDVEIVSALVGLAKPDPAIYRLTLERLGTTPETTVFVDDNRPNVDAAAALGIRAVHFTEYEALVAELEQWGVI